ASGMSSVFNFLSTDWGVATLAMVAGRGILYVVYRAHHHSWQNAQLRSAIENMTQGLCMMDGAHRMILCNERYLEMYGLTRQQVYPGCTMRELLEHRAANGTFLQDVDQYVAAAKQRAAEGVVLNTVVEVKGRMISIANRPIAGGGWVSTHEDVTER